MLGQTVIREAEIADAERIGLAHSVAAEEAYGDYFPPEWVAGRNTPESRAEQWAQTLREYAAGTPGGASSVLSDECGAVTGSGKPQRIFIAEDGERVLGFSIFGTAREQDAPFPYELHRLYVLSQAYGTGLAHRLLMTVHPEQTSSYLWVMKANTRAIAFYRKHGFEPDGAVEYLTGLGSLPKLRMIRRHKVMP